MSLGLNAKPEVADAMTRPDGGAVDVISSELSKLRDAEFGTRTELLLRYVMIVAGSVAAFIYTESSYPLLWGAAYAATQALCYGALIRGVRRGTLWDWRVGIFTYMATTLVFLSLPLGLFVLGDDLMAYCAGAALLTFGAFCLWREEPPRFLLIYDSAVAWVFAAAALYRFLPITDLMIGKAAMIMLTLGAAVYFTFALMATRENRGTLRAATQRATEAQKMEAIGRLSGGLAHDFNNILTVLQGNLELYNEVEDDTERHKLVAEAHLATLRASGLVRQLLAFARRAPLEPTRIQADEMIAEVSSMASRLLPATITVYEAAPVGQTHVRADRDQLLSALLNLVINARDAMQNRGTLTIAAGVTTVTQARPVKDLPPGDYVRFFVTDTGPGMSDDTLEKALEPFFTTKEVGAGSGLGLPSANGFAEQSGGALQIDTSPKGTTVAIYLPRVAAAAL